MSDETNQDIKPQRREPILQPMRIVQVPEAPTTQVSTSVDVTPNNPNGKKLVRSKKQIEAEARTKAKTTILSKPGTDKAVVKLPTDQELSLANQTRIDDLDRNAKLSRNEEQAPDIDEKWLEEVGGKSVSIAWLQTSVSVSGFISSESTFSPQKIRGLTMSWTDEGLLCQIKNQYGSKILLIPAANVKCMAIE